MSNIIKMTAPVGGKMNDAGYPFRGEYRVDKEINHGHSGVSKKAPTSLALKISGSNLVIEQLQSGRGMDLRCELAVDDGAPRPVAITSAGQAALAVPGDGREYCVTATVKGESGKHFCRMVFNGSEGESVIRVRAPTNVSPSSIYFVADGRRLYPVAGWYSIPLHARECWIAVDDDTLYPRSSRGGSRPRSAGGGSGSGRLGSPSSRGSLIGGGGGTMVIEAVPGINDKAVLHCVGSDQLIPLNLSEAVAIPANGGPFRIQLPAYSTAPPAAATGSASSPAGAGGGGGAPPAPVPVGAGGAPVPVAVGAVPEIEARVTWSAGNPCYTVGCRGHHVKIISCTGTSAQGMNTAQLQLPNRSEQVVRYVITEGSETGKQLFSHMTTLPALEAPPMSLRLHEDSGMLLVAGAPSSVVMVGPAGSSRTRISGAIGSRLNTTTAQHVTVEQTNTNGTKNTVEIDINAKRLPTNYSTPGTTPGATGAGATHEDPWIQQVVNAINASTPDETKRLISYVRPTTPNGQAILRFLQETVCRAAPVLTFNAHKDIVTNIQCPGYSVSAAIGTEPACLIPNNTSVRVPEGKYVALSAVNGKDGRVVATNRILLSPAPPAGAAGGAAAGGALAGLLAAAGAKQPGTASGGNTPAASNSPSQQNLQQHNQPAPIAGGLSDGDNQLIGTIIDSLQRHNMNPSVVADELSRIQTYTLSPTGQRLVPLLINCLRRCNAGSMGNREGLHYTCCNGYLSNIYTDKAYYDILGSVDNSPQQSISQRGRFPSEPLPPDSIHFVKLLVRDPTDNETKAEMTVALMGEQQPSTSQSATRPPPLQQQQLQYHPSGVSVATSPLRVPGRDERSPSLYQLPSSSNYHGSNTNGNNGGQEAPSPNGSVNTRAPPMQPQMLSFSPDRQYNQSSADHGNYSPSYGGGGAPTQGPTPYLDVSLQPAGQYVQARFVCAPEYRIVCDVDGRGGDTGRNDFVANVQSGRAHHVELSLVNRQNGVVFQQKFDIPAMSASDWGIALQDNGIVVDSDGSGTQASFILDNMTERAVQGGFIPVDMASAHTLRIRKYANVGQQQQRGSAPQPAGELSLKTPGNASMRDLDEVTKLYRQKAQGVIDDTALRRELPVLRNRIYSPQVQGHISALLEAWGFAAGAYTPSDPYQSNANNTNRYRYEQERMPSLSPQPQPHQLVVASQAPAVAQPQNYDSHSKNRVYFRLTGRD